MTLPRTIAAFAVTIIATVSIAPDVHARATCKNKQSYSSWMKGFKRLAVSRGVSQRTVSSALSGITYNRRVIAIDRSQKFFSQDFDTFSRKLATSNRIRTGKRAMKRYDKLFDRSEKRYGVPREVISAYWALESDFGIGMGKMNVIRSLATLAYDCRRSELFTDELVYALKILDRGDLRRSDMIGGWAGELGQTQFMPEHYYNHAVDFNGNGTRNLFKEPADIIGSTSAYLKHLGWRRGEPWLEQVRLTKALDWTETDLATQHPRSTWAKWGVKYASGQPIPADDLPASLVLPMGRNGTAFLAYNNFKVYTSWNESLNYSLTAAYLSRRLAGDGPMRRNKKIKALSAGQLKRLQTLLTRRGHDVGRIDGIVGAKTRAAIKKEQIRLGLPADSFPTARLLNALGARS